MCSPDCTELLVLQIMYMKNHMHIHVRICDGIWENPTFCIFHQNWDFAIFSIYNVWITSVLNINIYNSTISELQHFALLLPILRAINLHVLILKREHVLFKMLGFRRSGHIYHKNLVCSAKRKKVQTLDSCFVWGVCPKYIIIIGYSCDVHMKLTLKPEMKC